MTMSLSSSVVSQFVGTRVQIERVLSGRTLTQFAQTLAIGDDELAAYENGAERIPAPILLKAAKKLNRPVSCFFEGFNQLSSTYLYTKGL
jgi:transcriptional regulator with XRE-family HTH domain